ncbi:MAG: hypothetical protein ACI9XP_001475 [Lentimonas sp.]|jgi:hypothetical protein
MKLLASIFVLGLSLSAVAQDGVTIIIKGNRQVESAERIGENPTIVDTVMPTPVVDYPRLNLLFKTDIILSPIEAAEVKIVDQLPQLYNSYARIGVGTEFMPIGEFYFNNTRSRKFHYGAHLKHISSFGNLENFAPSTFDRNTAQLYGAIIKNSYTLGANIHARNQGFNYYGIPTDTIPKDSIAQRFSDLGIDLLFKGHKRDSAKLNYHFGVAYNNFVTAKPKVDSLEKWRAMENYFGFKMGGSYKLGNDLFVSDLVIQHNDYRFGIKDSLSGIDSGFVDQNTVVTVNPHIITRAFDNKLKGLVGLTLSFDARQKVKAYVYPNIELSYSLFDDLFIPYAGIRGGLRQNTLKSLSSQNEFILENITLRNEHKAIELYGGFKGTITDKIGFDINGRFANIKDKALFVTDTLHYRNNQFNVIYDTLNQATLEGSIYFQQDEKLRIDVIGRYNSYLLLNNTHAWNLPETEFILRGKYNLFDKILLQADFVVLGGRKALVYAPEEDAVLENNQYAKSLGFVVDGNLSIEYIYNKRISAFVQFNNFTAQRYARWYSYPVQGIQALGGFTFKF